jgi:hypothetical protein
MKFEKLLNFLEIRTLILLPESVSGTDSALYHYKKLNPAEASNSRNVMTWFMETNVLFGEELLEPHLYQLIKFNKPVNCI